MTDNSTAITIDERARRVEMIIKLHKLFKAKYTETESAMLENRREQPLMGFGVWDEEDERKARVREGELIGAYRGLQAKKALLTECWDAIVAVFGRSDIDLAMTEENQQIGDLPMLAEESK